MDLGKAGCENSGDRYSVSREEIREEVAMGPGPELTELQQRVEAVGLRFSEVAENSRRRGERLASLVDQVEKSVVRDRHEIDRLKQALTEARGEKAQILALLGKGLVVEAVDAGLQIAQHDPFAWPVAEELEEDPPEDGIRDPEWGSDSDEAGGDEDGDPLELTQMIAEDGKLKDLGSAGSRAGALEIQDIFKRVSMITGGLRET